ncbi:interleukin-20 receptor subunit alpha [Mastacembelus armatus]|uniref:Interleukin 20 receptor, alpha n=1 Tax=Mastacembelus armatus TaxID=205130 RepID=A0A3Q3MGM0_9TELE|nr:uncharacterized protein LOC113137604 [Mastacembelus armatus]
MWIVFVFLNLGLLHFTVSSSPPSPIDVVFSSVNLRNLLVWSPGNGTPPDTFFTVQYAIYGDSMDSSKGTRINWRGVRHCTEIVRNWCDLSNETWDQEQGYHARVRAMSRRASSKWALTQRRFDPKLDTSFGPPLITVELENNSAIITLKGPMRYQPNSHTPVVSMATFYPHMAYNLSIRNSHRRQTHHFLVGPTPYKYQLMEYHTEYCFSAKTVFLSMPIRCSPSSWHCITTPQDPSIDQLQRVVVGIVVPSLCICVLVVVGYFLRNYLKGKGHKSPYILNLPVFHHQPPQFPHENLNVIFITVTKDAPSDTDSAISNPACPITDPPPGYSPQRSETPPEPEEPGNDLPDDYGVVGVAPKISVVTEEDKRERRDDGGENGNSLCQRCTARDSYETKEWRVEDGHLVHIPTLQKKSCCSQSTHTYTQTQMPIHTQMHAQTEMYTLSQAHAWSQLNSVLLTASQASLQSLGTTNGVVDTGKEERQLPALFIDKTPQSGLFHIPLNRQTKEVGIAEDTDEKMRVRTGGTIDGGVEEENQQEMVPLLSSYVSNEVKDMSSSHTDQSDFLPHDYSVLTLAHNTEEDDDDDEEGTTCINWDPEFRKLVLPGIKMELDGLRLEEKGSEDRIGEKDEEVKSVKAGLRLENVFVRQPSEEEAEALRAKERGGETGWDDILTKWDLVISMDQ